METENAVEGGVTLDIDKGIGTISFWHPKSNSLPSHLLKELADTIKKAGDLDHIRVIILRSRGDKSFCAGASFDELVSISDYESGKKFFMGFANVINAARKCPKFIVGRVQGKAVGGGVGLASIADCCYAHLNASIKLSELAIGIGPFVVGPAVERKIGTSAFNELAINAGTWKNATWAVSKGLYNQVFETFDELNETVDELARNLAASNPEAMAFLKRASWSECTHWDTLLEERAEMSGKLVLSEFTKNAIAKFKQGQR